MRQLDTYQDFRDSWWHNGNGSGWRRRMLPQDTWNKSTDWYAFIITSLLFLTIYLVGKIIIVLIKGIFSLLALPFKKKCYKKNKTKAKSYNGYKAKSGRIYR